MYKKMALFAIRSLFCLIPPLFFAAISTAAAPVYLAGMPDLVNSVDKSRLLASLTYLTASPRDTPEAQEAVLTWLQTELAAAGVTTHFHTYQYDGKTFRNLVATIPENASPDPGEEHFVVGAHIDSVANSPGADDNAGGVAAILEAVRVLANAAHGKRVDFVFFTNEEIGRVGSAAYARDAKAAGEAIAGMIAVDMVAYGTADEDLDIATRPAFAWLADAFKEGSDTHAAVTTKVILDQACG